MSHQFDIGQLLCQDQRVTAHTQDVLLSWLWLGFEDGAFVGSRLPEFLSDFLVLAPCREGHQEILCHLANDLFHCSIFLSKRQKQWLLKTFSSCRYRSPKNFWLGKINTHYQFSFILSELIILSQINLSYCPHNFIMTLLCLPAFPTLFPCLAGLLLAAVFGSYPVSKASGETA